MSDGASPSPCTAHGLQAAPQQVDFFTLPHSYTPWLFLFQSVSSGGCGACTFPNRIRRFPSPRPALAHALPDPFLKELRPETNRVEPCRIRQRLLGCILLLSQYRRLQNTHSSPREGVQLCVPLGHSRIASGTALLAGWRSHGRLTVLDPFNMSMNQLQF